MRRFGVSGLALASPVARAVGAVNTIFVRDRRERQEEGRKKSEASVAHGDDSYRTSQGDDGKPNKRIYIGTNTDYVGVRDAVLRNFPDEATGARGRPGLVLGAGGAARAAVYALRACLGIGRIYVVNRVESEAEDMIAGFERADKLTGNIDAEIRSQVEENGDEPGAEVSATDPMEIVRSVEQVERLVETGATPAVMVLAVPDEAPTTAEERKVVAIMHAFFEKAERAAVVDMCYAPAPWTALARAARDAGCKVALGTDVMIYQAIEQDLLWTQRPVEDMPIEEVTKLINDYAAGKKPAPGEPALKTGLVNAVLR